MMQIILASEGIRQKSRSFSGTSKFVLKDEAVYTILITFTAEDDIYLTVPTETTMRQQVEYEKNTTITLSVPWGKAPTLLVVLADINSEDMPTLSEWHDIMSAVYFLLADLAGRHRYFAELISGFMEQVAKCSKVRRPA